MFVGRLIGLAIGAGLWLGASLGASSSYAFTVDGRVSSDDSYSVSYDLTYYVWNTQSGGNKIVSGGHLRLGRDGDAGDIYLMLELPTSLVDNVYGAPAYDSDSGWTQKNAHSFKDLHRSDAFEFTVATTSGDKFIKVDYLNADTLSAEFESTGFGTAISAATSLQYNLSQGYGDTQNSPDPYNSTPPSDWLSAVQYEIRLDGSRFEAGELINLADISSPWLHISPNKLRGEKYVKVKCVYYNNCELSDDTGEPPPVAMPAPGGAVIFALAAGLLGFRRRRRAARTS